MLERGYAVVRDANGGIVKRAGEISSGQALSLEFADGRAGAVAAGTAPPAPKPKPVQKTGKPETQGSLF